MSKFVSHSRGVTEMKDIKCVKVVWEQRDQENI
jgi:hypothetical protein